MGGVSARTAVQHSLTQPQRKGRKYIRKHCHDDVRGAIPEAAAAGRCCWALLLTWMMMPPASSPHLGVAHECDSQRELPALPTTQRVRRCAQLSCQAHLCSGLCHSLRDALVRHALHNRQASAHRVTNVAAAAPLRARCWRKKSLVAEEGGSSSAVAP